MKIGVLCDIHGNLPALEVVLHTLNEYGCDEIIGTGDVLTIGPESVECLHLLQSLEHFCMVSGNHERCFDKGFSPPYPPSMLPREAAHHQLVYDRLDISDRQWLRALPKRIERHVKCGSATVTLLFVHYPMDQSGAFLPNFEVTPENMDRAFSGESAQIVFYGHDHTYNDCIGKRRYVNPGPLGCPGKESEAPVAVFETDGDGWQIRRFLIPYDKEETVRRLRRIRTPDWKEVIGWFYE